MNSTIDKERLPNFKLLRVSCEKVYGSKADFGAGWNYWIYVIPFS